ncbi:MAG: AI-2E family transporter [Ornithinimicrobium sp.]
MSEPATGSSTSRTGEETSPDTETASPTEESSAQHEDSANTPEAAIDRSTVFGEWLMMLARWSGRLIVVSVAAVLVLWGLSLLWAGLLPVILALILTALLMPLKTWLAARGLPHTLSALLTLVILLAVVLGILTYIAPDVARQLEGIGSAAQRGLNQVRDWVQRGPLDWGSNEVNNAVERGTTWLKTRSGDIASGAFSGVSAASSLLVNLILVLALTFFFLKDGHRFLPWLRSVVGRGAGAHLTEVLARNWTVLGGFIRTQALVSLIDAFFIGLALVILGVPLALALTVITFFAGFIPIVGAVTAGALAVLVALVSNGPQSALIVLAVILAVQQLEGNVLSPMLQGKTMSVHPGLILVAVTIGGTLFGIVGVFLAVPLTASLVATARYVGDQLDLRTGLVQPEDVRTQTPEGSMMARRGRDTAGHYRAVAERKNSGPDADSAGEDDPG